MDARRGQGTIPGANGGRLGADSSGRRWKPESVDTVDGLTYSQGDSTHAPEWPACAWSQRIARVAAEVQRTTPNGGGGWNTGNSARPICAYPSSGSAAGRSAAPTAR